MDTYVLLLSAGAGGGALLLAIAGVQKLRRCEPLLAVLRAQGVIPAPVARAVVPLVPYGELAAAGAFVLSQVAEAPRVALLGVFTAWCAAYTAYLSVVAFRGSEASCGCLGSREPVNLLHVARVACMAASGALLALAPPAPATPARVLAVGVLSCFCALLYWRAPAVPPLLRGPNPG